MNVAIIQARLSSTRFPRKVLEAKLAGLPLLWHVVERLRPSRKLQKIVIATTTNPADDELVSWCHEHKIDVCRGSEQDVLHRYAQAAKLHHASVVVRITSDDPFKDYKVMDQVIERLQQNQLDFACNNHPASFPEGLDVEVMSADALYKADREAKDPFEREHVTQYFYRNPQLFKMDNVSANQDHSWLRWTIDTSDDYKMAAAVYEALYAKNTIFLYEDILDLLSRRKDIIEINSQVPRSFMYKK